MDLNTVPSRLVSLYNEKLGGQVQTDDVVVAVLAVLIATYYYLFHASAKVPRDFWFQVPQANGSFVSSSQKKADERRIAHAFEQHELDFIVFWGSQSGRSEIIARQFAKSLQSRFGLKTLAADLDDYDTATLASLKEDQRCAFIVSTYGDGDPPDSAEGLWGFLQSSKDGDQSLSSLRYVIFGLGNSNYRQYNYFAECVDARLRTLGATRLGELGAGDDAEGSTETDFLRWRKQTETLLQQVLGLSEEQVQRRYEPSFTIRELSSVSENDEVHHGVPVVTVQGRHVATPTTAVIKEARRLWETNDRLCLHLDVDLGAGLQIKYKTGDHLTVWPSNPDHEVEALLTYLGFQGKRQTLITVDQTSASSSLDKSPCPMPTTPEALLRNYLEICGRLSMDLVHSLAEFAPSDESRRRLLQVADDPDLFKTTVTEPQLTLAGLLKSIDHSQTAWAIPLSFLLERMKPMQPRYYSISSSAMINPRIASLTVVVNKDVQAPGQTAFSCPGLATSYLWAQERCLNGSDSGNKSLPSYDLDGPQNTILAGHRIFCNTRQTSFKMPAKSSSPIIMIGAGTGVAPFRAFVQERVQRSGHEAIGRTLLFMGFRNADVDYVYKEEWAKWRDSLEPGVFDYWTACSRDGKLKGKKRYVQGLVEERAKEVMELLEVTGCRLFLCGSASMARDVVNTLVDLRCEREGCSKDDALAWVRKLRQFGTLLEDVWG